MKNLLSIINDPILLLFPYTGYIEYMDETLRIQRLLLQEHVYLYCVCNILWELASSLQQVLTIKLGHLFTQLDLPKHSLKLGLIDAGDKPAGHIGVWLTERRLQDLQELSY